MRMTYTAADTQRSPTVVIYLIRWAAKSTTINQ